MPVSMRVPLAPDTARMDELDALTAAEWQRPHLDRLALVTVQELSAICPWCGGPRKWSLKYCSRQCGKALKMAEWGRKHRTERKAYFRAYDETRAAIRKLDALKETK